MKKHTFLSLLVIFVVFISVNSLHSCRHGSRHPSYNQPGSPNLRFPSSRRTTGPSCHPAKILRNRVVPTYGQRRCSVSQRAPRRFPSRPAHYSPNMYGTRQSYPTMPLPIPRHTVPNSMPRMISGSIYGPVSNPMQGMMPGMTPGGVFPFMSPSVSAQAPMAAVPALPSMNGDLHTMAHFRSGSLAPMQHGDLALQTAFINPLTSSTGIDSRAIAFVDPQSGASFSSTSGVNGGASAHIDASLLVNPLASSRITSNAGVVVVGSGSGSGSGSSSGLGIPVVSSSGSAINSASFPFVVAPIDECPLHASQNSLGFFAPPFNPAIEKFVTPMYSLSNAGVYIPIVPLCLDNDAHLPFRNADQSVNNLNAAMDNINGNSFQGALNSMGMMSQPSPHGRSPFVPLAAQADPSQIEEIWPGGELLYKWHPSIDPKIKALFEMAMVNIISRSSITFRNDESATGGFAMLRSDQGCQSISGYNGPNAPGNDVSCGLNCGKPGTCMHEILHSLGLQHAHSARYRDDFITINFNNLKPGSEDQFEKLDGPNMDNTGRNNEMYAYDSIMHYSRTAFSSSADADTIVCKDPQYQDVIGQRQRISPHDIIHLEKLYSARARYRYINVQNNNNEILQTVAVFTDLQGRTQTVPESGFIWTKPGHFLPFLFATNNPSYLLYVRTKSGQVLVGADAGSGGGNMQCQTHSPLGRICFEQRSF